MNNKLTDAIIVGAISAIERELPHLKKTKGENHPLVALYAVCGTALRELQEYRNAQPVAWTDAQELQDVEKDGCGYLFKANPITPHADPRRVIKLYTGPQPLTDAERQELQEYRNAQQVVPSKPTESDIPSWLNGEKRLHWLSGAEWMHNTFCAAPQPLTGASQAALDVLAERQRQVTAEGWTTEHDDEHVSGELAQAASTYAAHSNAPNNPMLVSILWPFEFETFKPCEPRRALVKAGALILAEIERLDRLEVKPL